MFLQYKDKLKEEDVINAKCNLEFEKELKTSNNNLIFGDNIDVLKILLFDYDLRGSVDLVYIDPPLSLTCHRKDYKWKYI